MVLNSFYIFFQMLQDQFSFFAFFFFFLSFPSLATSSKSSTNSGASSIFSFSVFPLISLASLTKDNCLGPSCLTRFVNTSLRFLVSWVPEMNVTFSLKEYSTVGFLNWMTVLSSLKIFTSTTSFNLRAWDFFATASIFLSTSTLFPLCLTGCFLLSAPFPPIWVTLPKLSANFLRLSLIALIFLFFGLYY